MKLAQQRVHLPMKWCRQQFAQIDMMKVSPLSHYNTYENAEEKVFQPFTSKAV